MGLWSAVDGLLHRQKRSKLVKENVRLRDEINGLRIDLNALKIQLTPILKEHIVGLANGSHYCQACLENKPKK